MTMQERLAPANADAGGASDAAAPWRLAAGLLIAGLAASGLVFSVPFPSRPVPASSPVIELTLTGYDSPASSSPRAAGADQAPPPAAPETAGTTETPPRLDNPEAPNPEPIAPPPAEASLAGGSARAAVSEAGPRRRRSPVSTPPAWSRRWQPWPPPPMRRLSPGCGISVSMPPFPAAPRLPTIWNPGVARSSASANSTILRRRGARVSVAACGCWWPLGRTAR